MQSLTNDLQWCEWDNQHDELLLTDGISMAAIYELHPPDCTGRESSYLEEITRQIEILLTDPFPQVRNSGPWIVQFFHRKIPLDRYARQAEQHLRDRATAHPEFREHYWQQLTEHWETLNQPNGAFVDEQTGMPFRARQNQIFAVVYRMAHGVVTTARYQQTQDTLQTVARSFEQTLQSSGFRFARLTERDFYEWMGPFLSPNPFGNGDQFLELYPYQTLDASWGRDYAAQFSVNEMQPNHQTAIFDGIPRRFVSVMELRKAPVSGHLAAERLRGDNLYAALDRLPDGCVYSQVIVVVEKSRMADRIKMTAESSPMILGEAAQIALECEQAQDELARPGGSAIYLMWAGVTVEGQDETDLARRVQHVATELGGNELKSMAETGPLYYDALIRHLPANYDARALPQQARFKPHYTHHIACLTPLYGGVTGTVHPTQIGYGRNGAAVGYDPFHDYYENMHVGYFGRTGSGKSARMINDLYSQLAVNDPYVVIIENGDSFGLAVQHLQSFGYQVDRKDIQPGDMDISMPLFLDLHRHKTLAIDNRDVIGESLNVLQIMITGGDKKEMERLTRGDTGLLRDILVHVADMPRDRHVLPIDIQQALQVKATETGNDAIRNMAQTMSHYTTGIEVALFNKVHDPTPPADITHINFGQYAKEGYEDKRILLFVALLQQVHHAIEQRRGQGRPTIVIVDECQLFYVYFAIIKLALSIVQMWRKLGAGLWSATTSLKNMESEASLIFEMMEWVHILNMGKKDQERLNTFLHLTKEQNHMIAGLRNQKAAFKELALLAPAVQGCARLRSIYPPLFLAHSMTAEHEVADRYTLMRDKGITELEAAARVAERLKASQTEALEAAA